ncbi:hypothetical protein HMPREF9630_01936 [Peptoanaerobacter stomatis]|uniref:SLH domain-containing protein n=1 Tax=Peptoanaerobacter stomatis TaxID=796937 RepID=V9HUK1_9FIRM|nr:S-layer homology domain-containing protein [Peptoanaerobacter stomatis]EHL16218.1 hypothetical protein HMPREF9630_01936 [Peptoanaerobacter stomatis]
MKKILCLLLCILIFFSSGNIFSYAQVMDEWARPAYKNLIDKKILPDVLMGEKNLKDSITRLEFTHLIITYLLSNKNYNLISSKKEYSDVNDTFVNLASNLNITTGYTDGTFKPNMNITRSEAAVIANNVEILLGTSKNGTINNFKDYKFIPNWAEKGVGSMVAIGAMSGYPNRNFMPSKNISRQEAIVLVDKLLKNNKSNNLIDAFNISKNDEYMSKVQYDFALSNIPMSKYKIDTVKHSIFLTDIEKRQKIYNDFKKFVPFSNNEILVSPNLIFDDGNSSYIIGIEIKKTINGKLDQRVFMVKVYTDNNKSKIEPEKEYSPWFTVSK